MMGFESQDDYEPLGHIGGYPVHAATLLAGIHSVMLVVCTIAVALGAGAFLETLTFSSSSVLKGWAWQPLTSLFIHLPHSPGTLLSFAIEMFLGLFVVGREVERFLGRRIFWIIYLSLALVTPVLLLGCSLLTKQDYVMEGSWPLHLLLFVVFATIYPNFRVFASVPAKWLAAVVAGGFALYFVAKNEWANLFVSWGSIVAAYAATRMAGVGDGLDVVRAIKLRFTRQPAGPARPKTKALSAPEPEPEATMETVDSVLEKISKHGISSLTSSERATLERARTTLLNRGKKDH